MWVLFALLSAVFAALTTILAKKGLEGVPSNLATAIRTGGGANHVLACGVRVRPAGSSGQYFRETPGCFWC